MRSADAVGVREKPPTTDITVSNPDIIRLMSRQGVSRDDLEQDFGKEKVAEVLRVDGHTTPSPLKRRTVSCDWGCGRKVWRLRVRRPVFATSACKQRGYRRRKKTPAA